MKTVHIILAFAIICNAVANILIKESMKAKQLDIGNLGETFRAIVFNPTLLVGVFCFGLALAAYSFVLSEVKLSIAYPIMTSLGFLIVVSYSFAILHEQLTGIQVGGLALILAGVWMVASNLG